jgi:hypothetical protein
MGAKVTTEIDPYIKQVFEGMKGILGITYKEILEEGILAKIMDIDPVKAEEIEIMRLEFQLSAHRAHLVTLRVSNQHVNEKTAAAQKTNGIEIERQEWFKRKAEWLARMIDKDSVPWNSVVQYGPFNSVKEAKEWVLEHLPEWRQSRED